MKNGKISAAQKEWAKAYALKDPTGFSAFVEAAPCVVPVGELNIDSNVQKKQHSEATMLACKMLAVTEDDIKKYGEDD